MTRAIHIVEKIDKSVTGLNGSIFVHVDFVPNGKGLVVQKIAVSEKGKEGSTLDKILSAVGDSLTAILVETDIKPERRRR